jgi:hypothetical protein
MSNQNESHVTKESLGNSLLPIEAAWKVFSEQHFDPSFTDEQRHNAKYIFYCSAVNMYNILTGSIKNDFSMQLFVHISELMLQDIDTYFEQFNGLQSSKATH